MVSGELSAVGRIWPPELRATIDWTPFPPVKFRADEPSKLTLVHCGAVSVPSLPDPELSVATTPSPSLNCQLTTRGFVTVVKTTGEDGPAVALIWLNTAPCGGWI